MEEGCTEAVKLFVHPFNAMSTSLSNVSLLNLIVFKIFWSEQSDKQQNN